MFTLLHCADLHLEASFAPDHLAPSVGNWRRGDLQAVLGRLLALAREQQADAVTIGGDLYEQEYALPDTADLLREQFAALAPTRVFIAPGEYDPHTDDSLYALTSWPPNVTIMAPGPLACHALAPDLFLWGAGYAPGADPDILAGFHVDREGTHLLLLHAGRPPVAAADGPFQIDAAALPAAGFQLALLGHLHSGEGHAEGGCFVYPGSPEPLREAEAGGDHLALLVQVEGSTCSTRALPVSQWRYPDLRVDLSGSSALEEAAALVRQALREAGAVDQHSACRVTLTGARRFDLDLQALRALIETSASVQYQVRQSMARSVEQMAYEATLRGQFVRRISARLDAAPSEAERELLLTALNLGLRALDGRQVRSDESG